MTTDRRSTFHAWATVARPRLRRTAYLLCGEWHQAEDLVQETLVRVYGKWRQLENGHPDGYARTTLLNAYRSARRRPWRRETSTDQVLERGEAAAVETDRYHEREVLRAALMELGRAQREVVILRYWDDLSVADVADALKVSTGTVKSQAARGRQRLREAMTSAEPATNKGEMP